MAEKNLSPISGRTAQVTIEVDGGQVGATMTYRVYSTGSDGFGWQGKVDGKDGRYQVNINAVRIGSGKEPQAAARVAARDGS